MNSNEIPLLMLKFLKIRHSEMNLIELTNSAHMPLSRIQIYSSKYVMRYLINLCSVLFVGFPYLLLGITSLTI